MNNKNNKSEAFSAGLSAESEILLMGIVNLNPVQVQCGLELNGSLSELDDFLSPQGGVLHVLLDTVSKHRVKILCEIKSRNSIENLNSGKTNKDWERELSQKMSDSHDNAFSVMNKILKRGMEPVSMETKVNGITPLCQSAMLGVGACTTLLVRKGADMEAKTPFGRTPLQMAAVMGNSGTVKRLCGLGAEKNTQDQEGATAAILAAKNGNTFVMRALVRAGADMNVKSASQLTAASELMRLDSAKGEEWKAWEKFHFAKIIEDKVGSSLTPSTPPMRPHRL